MNNEFIFLLLTPRGLQAGKFVPFTFEYMPQHFSYIKCGLYDGIQDINDNRKINF